MPDGDNTTQGQEPTTNPTNEPAASGNSRSLDAFPEEAQDYIKRLRSEAAGYRNELKSAGAKLKEFEDAGKSAQELLESRAAQAEKALEGATLKLARFEVAAEAGLPLKYASRLQGSTEEELKADAEQLKKDFGIGDDDDAPAGGSGFDGGVRRSVRKPKTMNGLIRQASGR